MKIGYFATNFPYSDPIKNDEYFGEYVCGGSPRAAYYLAKEMAKRGHDVKVFTTSINSKNTVDNYGNVTIYRFGTIFKHISSHISMRILYQPLKQEVDIVHGHFDIPPGPLAPYLYSRKKNVPLVITHHGDWIGTHGGFIRKISVSLFNKYLVGRFLAQAKVIISPSGSYIEESRFLRKNKEKIVVIPNGINLKDYDVSLSKEECRKELGLPIEKNIIISVGSLIPYKGPDVLVNAMPKIIKEIPDATLLFVGKGEMEDELRLLSKKLGVDKHIKFAGFVGDSFKKALFYKSADIFAFPSLAECFPIVNLEAMASGVPIVASKIGGIPDAVKDGENGLLVPPKDSETLADAIIYLLENEDLREKMGSDGKKKAKDYSWETIAEDTEKVYEGLV